MNREFSVFISSSDEYSDLWDLFFQLFKKYWPGYDGKIYLNTQITDYKVDGLNVIATKVGKGLPFGETFQRGLNKVDTDDVLLIMIDYLFMDKVEKENINNLYEWFKDNKLDSLRLKHHPYTHMQQIHNGVCAVRAPQFDMFSFQIAFWCKDVLRKMVLAHENPWAAEWYGTKRANLLNIRMHCVDAAMEPITYLSEGALHKGKWVAPIVEFLKSQDIGVDYPRRGMFDPGLEINVRLKHRLVSKLKRSPSALRSMICLMGLVCRVRLKSVVTCCARSTWKCGNCQRID